MARLMRSGKQNRVDTSSRVHRPPGNRCRSPVLWGWQAELGLQKWRPVVSKDSKGPSCWIEQMKKEKESNLTRDMRSRINGTIVKWQCGKLGQKISLEAERRCPLYGIICKWQLSLKNGRKPLSKTEFWVRCFTTANNQVVHPTNLAGVPATDVPAIPRKHVLCQHYLPGAMLHTRNKLYRRQPLALPAHTGQSGKKVNEQAIRIWETPGIMGA